MEAKEKDKNNGKEAEEEVTEEAGEETLEGALEEEEAEAKEEKVEEAKPPEKGEVEEEFVEERFYTIPLGKAWLMPPNKRAPKAIRLIRDFVKRHMKMEAKAEGEEEEESEPKRLIISNEVNEKVWSRGIEKPPTENPRKSRQRQGWKRYSLFG
jgi:large subunit ribosomal protein L31e